MSQREKDLRRLAKLVEYALGRRPDEFGLAPDESGRVRIKDLLKAIAEDPEWGNLRRAALSEMCLTLPAPPVEMDEHRIRATNRDHLPQPAPAPDPPALLYTCVRKKAHPVALEKGISPLGHHPRVVLCADAAMAERIGRRFDPDPVRLTVDTRLCREAGLTFFRVGESLYLTDAIPPACFTAPPLPERRPEREKRDQQKEKAAESVPKTPGSYSVQFERKEGGEGLAKRDRRRKDMTRDKDKRKARRQKQRLWPGEQ